MRAEAPPQIPANPTTARALLRGRSSNSQRIARGELARLFSVDASEGNEELSIAVAISVVRTEPEPAGQIVVPQARVTWGGYKGGSSVLADCPARINVEACTTLTVDASPTLFTPGPPSSSQYTFFVTAASGSIALPLPNQVTVAPLALPAPPGATPREIPTWASELVVPTDKGTFVPTGQIIVQFWATSADYPTGVPVSRYVVPAGAILPIPGTASAYTLEAGSLIGTINCSPFFRLRI